MSEVHRDIIVICGPTAAGKTGMAVRIAYEFGLEIISADSRQVYRKLDIGSGKDLHEYVIDGINIPYHMIDIIDPADVYSLYHYQRDCYDLLRIQINQTKPVIMEGGSGLYIESVLKKYMISQVPEDVEFRERMMEHSKEDLETLLKEIDPKLFSRTDVSSKKRIVRSLEIKEFSKYGQVAYTKADDINITPHIFCVNPDKEELRRLIRVRLYKRMEAGMIEEVRNLLREGISPERLVQMGMEYREVTLYLTGQKNREKMLTDLEREIRHMAKSQMTYFRGMERRGLQVEWIKPGEIDKVRELAGSLK